MGKQKVSVGVTSAAGYGVTLAAVVAAALDYIGGDHSQPTKTTLVLGIVAGVSFVTTQVGRYVQAHALAKVAPALEAERRYEAEAKRYEAERRYEAEAKRYANADADFNADQVGYAHYTDELKEEGDDEPERLTDDEAAEDPEMGDPLDASPESFVADPKDHKGGADHPERW